MCDTPTDENRVDYAPPVENRCADRTDRSSTDEAPPSDDDEPRVERTTPVEVNGKRFEVSMWVPEATAVVAAGSAAPKKASRRERSSGSGGGSTTGAVEAPMQGTIVKILVEEGQEVTSGEGLLVLEAMKMENQINAEADGTVTELKVAAGDTVGGGDVLLVIE